jgi:hypothetical protein
MGQNSARDALINRLREQLESLERRMATIQDPRSEHELREDLLGVRRLLDLLVLASAYTAGDGVTEATSARGGATRRAGRV